MKKMDPMNLNGRIDCLCCWSCFSLFANYRRRCRHHHRHHHRHRHHHHHRCCCRRGRRRLRRCRQTWSVLMMIFPVSVMVYSSFLSRSPFSLPSTSTSTSTPMMMMLKIMPVSTNLSLIPMLIHLRKIISSLIKNAFISKIINIIVVVIVVGFKLQKKI